MGDYVPKHRGDAYTRTALTGVTGGQLVKVNGSGSVDTATAATHLVMGVAAFDAATGEKVSVETGGVQRLIATGTVTAGQLVEAATNGTVATHTNGTNDFNVYGLALTTATAGNLVEVLPVR